MFIHKCLCLSPGIADISHFHLRECLISCRLARPVSSLPARTNAHDVTGIKTLNSLVDVDIRQEGFRYRKLSSRILERKDNRVVIEENSQDSDLSSAYDTAMEALSSLITRQKRGDRTPISSKYGKLDRMLMYVKILGLEEHIANLKIIHVAGTKGKGSTCTFCKAILRECGFRTGLFTSPHLIDVRERFRLDGLDIPQDKFLQYFWECWNKLKENVTDELPMPPLFQFLTVLAFKIFSSEGIDVAIFEVGLGGGTNDSTNVIKDPVVCGITALGMDHMETLGDTLALIASHKAGIFKPQVPAFTVPQLSEAMEVLEERANKLTVPLEVAKPLDCRKLNGIKLSLSGDHQFMNAGLSVALCKCWLQRTGNWEKLFQHATPGNSLQEPFLRGLSTAHLAGRAQIVHDSCLKSLNKSEVKGSSSGDLIFYLDGAHSPESMEACARWFSYAVKESNNISSFSPSSKFFSKDGVWGNVNKKHENDECNKIYKQILLFNRMDVRDPQVLLPTLVNTCAASGTRFSKAIFVPSISKYTKITSASSAVPLESSSKDLTWQFNLQRVWEKMIHGKGSCHWFVALGRRCPEATEKMMRNKISTV